MIEGRPSVTAQRVASYRLGFDRVTVPYGHPDADERLTRSVAAGIAFEPSPGMERYLRLRTAFFDRVVVNAIERGVTQLVGIGAGYDGRALRYAHGSVRWFEVDHPATSADKTTRLGALDIDARGITFVGWDLAQPGLTAELTSAGFDPDGPTQFLLEGVVVYLPPDVTRTLLREVRALCAPGSRLALSMSVGSVPAERRARFGQTVTALGEPVRSEALTPEQATELFATTGWETVDLTERSERAGLVVLRPRWSAASVPPTAGITGRYMETVMYRSTAGLAEHMAHVHGRVPSRVKELDLGVFRLDFATGPSWIARIGPPGRGRSVAEDDAHLLRTLQAADFPAERPATDTPVSELDGQGVLVTELIVGRRPTNSPALGRHLAELLARLHVITGPGTERPGGAWHHLVPAGATAAELPEARRLLAAASSRVRSEHVVHFEALMADLGEAVELCGLPAGLVHPDFVVANALSGPGGHPRFIDWSGAGQGPRIAAFGCLLWGAAHKSMACVTAAAQAYAAAVDITPAELDALGQAVFRRPVILACWSFVTGRRPLPEVARGLDQHRRMCARATAAALDAMT